MATFAEIFNGLSFRSILRMRVQNLKFVALPIPEIIGGTKKMGSLSDTPPKFLMGFWGWVVWEAKQHSNYTLSTQIRPKN